MGNFEECDNMKSQRMEKGIPVAVKNLRKPKHTTYKDTE